MTSIARIDSRLNTTLLGEAVAIELGVSNEDGSRAVQAVLGVIARAVTAGHPVTVTNFGTWTPVHRPAHTARNPMTGEPVTVPARQEMTFRASDRLRELVASQDPVAASIRKLAVIRTEPCQEIAAEQATLDILTADLRKRLAAASVDVPNGVIGDYFGFPLVADPGIQPGVLHIRPHRHSTTEESR